MLPHVMRQGTDDHPNKRTAAALRGDGAPRARSRASLFVGFPHADIRNAGLSAVVVTDNDEALAERLRDELLAAAWARARSVRLQARAAGAVGRARQGDEATDDAGPGNAARPLRQLRLGRHDGHHRVLAEILRQRLEEVAAFAICDPQAVQQVIAAGVGADVTLSIGGKRTCRAIPSRAQPLQVTGRVRTISDGRYRNEGPMAARRAAGHGSMRWCWTPGEVEIVLISRHVEPHDINCLLALGIDPTQKRYVMLKSRMHWRAGIGTMAKAVVECAGEGVCTSDYGQLDFSRCAVRSTRSTRKCNDEQAP